MAACFSLHVFVVKIRQDPPRFFSFALEVDGTGHRLFPRFPFRKLKARPLSFSLSLFLSFQTVYCLLLSRNLKKLVQSGGVIMRQS